MKEMMKSKVMIGLAIFILGLTYMSGVQTRKMEENTNVMSDEYVVMNLK